MSDNLKGRSRDLQIQNRIFGGAKINMIFENNFQD